MLKILARVLPLRIFLFFGRRLGELGFFLSKERRHIALKNLKIAFPDLTQTACKKLAMANFRSVGMGFTESIYAWNAPKSKLKKIAKVEGLENIPATEGALIMFFHFTSLEIGCSLFALTVDTAAVYRKQNNPKFNLAVEAGRKRFASKIIASTDIRSMLRHLKSGKMLYASDQHSTKGDWTLVDFFNHKMAVTTAASRIVKATGVRVLPLLIQRTQNSYKIKVHAAFENFGEDPVADARLVMSWLEKKIKKMPEQYLWIHNLFKSPAADRLNRQLR